MDIDEVDDDPSNPGGQSAVARLVYASRSRVRESVFAEMEKIRASALRHNAPVGVYTALLYQSGWFLQWKEGPGQALLKIMDRVAFDPRHSGLRIVHASRGPRLLSGPWSMAIVQARETPSEMEERVIEVRKSMEEGSQLGPPSIWRKLSTPMRHPGAARQGDPDGFQRVMVCSASGDGSFQLVRWLANLHGQEVVQRRFAGPSELDVGTDYVDFEEPGLVVRVIAMARHGLSLPLTRAFIPDYSHLLLLLCGEPDRDLALIQKVSQACEEFISPPSLLVVAPDQRMHSAPYGMARRTGMVYLDATANTENPEAVWAAVQPMLVLWRDAHSSGQQIDVLRRVLV